MFANIEAFYRSYIPISTILINAIQKYANARLTPGSDNNVNCINAMK